MLPDSFAETGFHAARVGEAPLTRFQVFGERSSGTNFVKRLIGRNTRLKHTDEMGWKHGFCQMMAVPRDLVLVCVVRNPERWALSMHAKPWHATPDLQSLEFSEFLRAEWTTILERPPYSGKLGRAFVGQTLQQDLHPITGRPFDSLFALRRAKLANLMSLAERGIKNCVYVRLENAQADPQAMLGKINNGLQLTDMDGEFRPVIKPQGWRFRKAVEDRPAPPKQMSDEDRAFMWSVLDQPQEAALGYHP